MAHDVQPMPGLPEDSLTYKAIGAVGKAAAGTLGFAIGGLPVASVASDLVDLLIKHPLEARRDEWLNDLATRLHELGVKVDGLASDPAFISAFVQTAQAAIKTHRARKLAMLQNAVINLALGKRVDDIALQMLLDSLDRLNELHVAMLAVSAAPGELIEGNTSVGITELFIARIAGVEANAFGVNPRLIVQRCFADLGSLGLVHSDTQQFNAEGADRTVYSPLVTDFGNLLLGLIAEPDA